MKPWVKDPALAGLCLLVSLGALCAGCSAPPQGGVGWLGGPSSETEEEEPLDPRAPLASIICERPVPGSVDSDVGIYMISAMNHKLDAYPEFAEAIGIQTVSACEDAFRFAAAYPAYAQEHPGFDADEPLPPSPDGEAEAAPADDQAEVPKLANVPVSVLADHSVVRIEFSSCQPIKGKRCPLAGNSWVVHKGTANEEDLRDSFRLCSGTLISKHWVLTSAHCITLAAIDRCMRQGKTLTSCTPRWDNYGAWKMKGSFITDVGSDGIPGDSDSFRDFTATLGLRSYVMTKLWSMVNLTKNAVTCDPLNPMGATPACADNVEGANHDLALLYVDYHDDDRLPPRVEDNSAKRISIVPPSIGWHLDVAGFGLPLGNDGNQPLQNIRRRGTIVGNPPGTTPDASMVQYFQAATTPGAELHRIVITTPAGGVYACPGDSGGPIMRTGLRMSTNRGIRENLDAIVAVTSISEGHCGAPGAAADTFPLSWTGTLVNVKAHLDFIDEQLKRWPLEVHQCTPRTPTGAPGGAELEECWGKPCTKDGSPCSGSEVCQFNPRFTLNNVPSPAPDPACGVCQGFRRTSTDNPEDQLCNCIEGQCVAK